MKPPELSRRTIMKAGLAAATFVATTNAWTPRKTVAARDQKLVFWLQPNFNATADRILEEQIHAYAKQAGLKDQEVQILRDCHEINVPDNGIAAARVSHGWWPKRRSVDGSD